MNNNITITNTPFPIYIESYTSDSIVNNVIRKFINRSELGQIKYGTTLDRTDLKTLDWINHAQEELMDGILYLEKLKKTIEDNKAKDAHCVTCEK
jgi:hypothetical protein